jgi:putative Mg2+ transporter-C (MgtC) family protein
LSAEQELEACFRLLVALFLGISIGLEREYHHHAAGLRTMAAVSVGSCLFSVIGLFSMHTDPTRIAAQVVTGVGFLGAGAILRSGVSVHGLTTAAAIWVVAAIGMAAGFGLFILSTFCALMVIVLLVVLKRIEDIVFPDTPQKHQLRRANDVEPAADPE